MKRMFLLGSIIWGAILLSQYAFAEQQQGCLKVKDSWTEYDALATGGSVGVHFKLRSHGCHLPLDFRPEAVSFTPETQPGVELSVFGHSFAKIRKSDKGPMGKAADELELVLSAKADNDLAPGKYEIPAVLNYQSIDDKGDIVQRSMPLTIAVKVVPKGTKLHPKEAPDPLKPLKMTGLIAAVIVTLPLWFTLWIAGTVTGHPILPDC